MADALPMLIAYVDTDHFYRFNNKAYESWFGRPLGQVTGHHIRDVVGAEAYEQLKPHVERALAGEAFSFEAQITYRDGGPRDVHVEYVPDHGDDGRVIGYFGLIQDISDRRRSETLRDTQNRVLELAVQDEPLGETLEALVGALETQSAHEVIGSILLLDEDGRLRHGAGAGLPEGYRTAIDGTEIGPKVGSCGTAAYRKAPVYVADIAKDPLWADFRELALSHGLRACWSTPILSSGGEVLGTFAMYYREPREPMQEDLELVEFVTRSASLVIERKRSEQALRDSAIRFRTVFENASVGMIEVDADWRILLANSAFCDITGYSLDELIGQSSLAFTHPDDISAGEVALRSVVRPETDRARFEKRYIRKDGQIVWIRSNLARISAEGERPRFLKVVEDITDAREAREALDEQRRTLETLNRVGAAMSAELDLQRVVQLVTDAGVELTGAQFGAFFYNVLNDKGESYMLYTLSGADRSDFDKFGMPRNTAVFAHTFEGKGVVRSADITKDPRYGKNAPHNGMPEGHLPVVSYLAVPVVGRSGEVIGGLFFGHPERGRFTEEHERLMTGIAAQAAVSIDNARLYQALQQANETLEHRVTERTAELEEANEALRQAQKMEAIGQLTGGIAHDFNNMLTVIRGSADVLRRPDVDEDKRKRYVDAIAETSDRAARLTGQLLAFARRQALKPEVFDAVQRISSIGEMLQTLLGSRIQLDFGADCDSCFVEADAAQFETALVNMAVNARDAMDGEGRLSIQVGKVAALPASLAHGASGAHVAISVSDTGEGIAPEDLDRIFDPFFTTKEVGKGTGLGLSQVYGFAKQSGGEISVRSDVGAGTSFTLYLPQADGESVTVGETGISAPELKPGGKVLVVEDNSDVGHFAEQVLAELGFSVRRANNADEALELLDEDPGFDVIFSDVVMPGIDGFAFAAEVQERWPGLPVVLTSGYSHVLSEQPRHAFPLLQKPYSLEALQQALAKALRR